MKTSSPLSLLPFLLLPLSSASAALVGDWQFDDPADLGKAAVGSALTFTGAVSSATGAGSGGAADFAKGAWAAVTSPIPANGSSGFPTRTNQYTIVVDFMVPDFTDAAADNGTFTGLFDFDNGGSDADFFIRKQANATELGVSTQWPYIGAGPTANGGGTSGTVRANTWYRLVLAVDNGVGRSIYLNGTLIGSYGTGTLDATRQSLSTTTPWRLLWDNDGETSRVVVSELALMDTRLSAAEVTLLGTAGSPVNPPRAAPITWKGGASGEWSNAVISAPKNWVLDSDGLTTTDFQKFDKVTFDDNAAGATPAISLSNGDVEPGDILFNNDIKNFTLGGSGAITGSSGLVKVGAGSLTISNANTFTGATQISSGILNLQHAQALQGSVVITNYGSSEIKFGSLTAATLGGLGGDADLALKNASSQPLALTVGSSASATFGGLLSGSGSLTKIGSGRQTLNYDNTYSGGTTVAAGTLVAGSPTAFGTAPVVSTGGSIEFAIASGSESTVATNITLPGGTGVLSLFGSFGFNRGAPGPGTATRLTGKISGGSADRVFRMSDTLITGEHDNTTILDNPSNDFLGQIEAWRGTIAFTSDAALGDPSNDILLSTENLLGSLRFDADNITLNAGRTIVLYSNQAPMPINTQAFTGTVAGDFSGVGNLVKQGSGTLILTGTNNATGITTVSEGTLRVNGSFATGGGTVTVNATGTLGGTGSIARAVAVAGKIAPGASAGTLTTGSTAITGTYAVEVDGASADQLVVNGDLDITGATLDVSLLGGGFTQQSYVIATYTGTLTGSFATVTPGYTVTYAAGQLVLKQGSASGFDAWAAGKGVTGFDADPDNDGISNGIEFVIGGEPAPGVASNSAALLPQASYQAASGDFVFLFRRTPESAYLNPSVEYSLSLGSGTWIAAPAGTVTGTQAGADLVEVRIPSSLATGRKIFARLKVSQ
ncbi:autotransporter-associated beta strand repeat-containing protein [Haloferula sp. BvORR071]|uniref:autotransporter-associated beta strand repeat-containing protein n=1 Tax=Haloferula sp. BvORR071 TaxID=1396141 RepID=UPI000553FEFC|nr:autotransporter-associated beta strand repeat-containing protein [Haloferula sp. BvORR071]